MAAEVCAGTGADEIGRATGAEGGKDDATAELPLSGAPVRGVGAMGRDERPPTGTGGGVRR